MQIRTAETADPLIRMVGARIAENVGAGSHSLTEFFRECGERRVIDPERPKTIPCKRHRHPPCVNRVVRCDRTAATDAVDDARQPRAALIRPSKREESIPRCPCGRASQQEVL